MRVEWGASIKQRSTLIENSVFNFNEEYKRNKSNNKTSAEKGRLIAQLSFCFATPATYNLIPDQTTTKTMYFVRARIAHQNTQ